MFKCSVNLGFGFFSLFLKFLTLFLDQSVDGESWSSLPAGKSSVLLCWEARSNEKKPVAVVLLGAAMIGPFAPAAH